ncbi:TIGR03503 family protein [Brumicola pallidula]|nr:TIGR03503 family protein [Glaciecola pallidula]
MKNNLKKWFGVANQHNKIFHCSAHAALLFASLCMFVPKIHAQEDRSPERDLLLQNPAKEIPPLKRDTPPIVPLGTDFQNSVLLLNNRFRVDSDVDEVTMVFFRDRGSAPVVLVRPDGSKIFIENDEEDPNVQWYETQTYDMISIKKPMPGPWQAVGQVLEGSKVMVIADIVLDAQPIPRNIYSGEIIKQTAVLKNNGKQVDFSPFRDVVSLTIDFVSNNNPNFENFGLGTRTIARFQDNGEGLDEIAGDGVFTGQFNLSIPSGEWRPTFGIRTPLYNREQINETVILHPNPIFINVKVDETNEAEHVIMIDTDSKHIKLDSLLLDGKVTHPNGDTDNVTMTETNDLVKVIKVKNTGFGIYRIKLTAFATTADGREVIINVPEHTFVTIAPPEPEPIPTLELEVNDTSKEPAQPISMTLPIDMWTATDTVSFIIAINLFIFVFGGIGIFLVLNKRKYPNDHIILRCKLACFTLLDKLKNLRKSKLKSDAVE